MPSHRWVSTAICFTFFLFPVLSLGQSKESKLHSAQEKSKERELTEIQYLEAWFDARSHGDLRTAYDVGKAYLARYPNGALVEEFRNWVKKAVEVLDARLPPAAASPKETAVAATAKESSREDLLLESMLADLQENAIEEVRLTSGRTLLMLAAANGNSQRVNALLRQDVQVNWMDTTRNWTALVYAIRKGDARIVRALMAAGADLSIKDKDGRDAFDHARLKGDAEIIRILQEGGRQ